MIISLTPVEVETVSCKGRFIIMILLGFYDALGKLEIGPYHLMIVILLQEIIKHFFFQILIPIKQKYVKNISPMKSSSRRWLGQQKIFLSNLWNKKYINGYQLILS